MAVPTRLLRCQRLKTAFRSNPRQNGAHQPLAYARAGRFFHDSWGAPTSGLTCCYSNIGQQFPKFFSMSAWRLSEQATAATAEEEDGKEKEDDYHSIIKNTERSRGSSESLEFQAETRKLLDIVAKSLYSEKEVFIRELVSNASDALEKLRYIQTIEANALSRPLEIHIALDENKKTFTIQDTGIGMDRQSMIDNLGTIAKSGSKAFLEEINGKSDTEKNIIGQFGVGFYSSFMVAERVEVFSRHAGDEENKAWKWTSDGSGVYELSEAEGVEQGTKIVLHLKGDSYDYCKEEKVKEVITKYSNFVGVPIYLNGHRINIVEALWLKESRDITDDQHEEFYRFIANAFDKPRYHLHYKADAPLNIRALFYVPEYKPTLFESSRETEVCVSLYCRKVMIMPKAATILPRWLRFCKGVVDSEDIPLNLSREMLQNNALIKKLNWVLTNRLLKFFHERSRKDPEKYLKFYEDYGLFFREGIVTSPEQDQREEVARLLRFESSKCDPGKKISLDDYVLKMKAGGRNIYYFSAPSRVLAESSPYMEAMKDKEEEVLFLFEPYDELVLMNLGQFDKKTLKSIESETSSSKAETEKIDEQDDSSLSQSQADELLQWLQLTLGNRVSSTKLTKKLVSHPCIVSVTEMGAARHFVRTTLADRPAEERNKILQPTLEVNPSHPIVHKLNKLRTENPELSRLVAEQIYDNAMIAAGLMDDPRSMLTRMNDMLTKALEKH